MNMKAIVGATVLAAILEAVCWPSVGAQPPFIEEAILKTPNSGVWDNPVTVVISGDTLVVGAAQDAGAVYVYTRQGTNWIPQADLQAGNPGLGDKFGYSVAISGDLIVVGAPGEDSATTQINGDANSNSYSNAGAAYVFARTGTNWIQEAYLKPANTGAGDEFGGSVAIDGDRIVVGARREASGATSVNGDMDDNSSAGRGAAYLFRRTGPGQWEQEAYLKAFVTSSFRFGQSCSIDFDTVLIGASGSDQAFVFVRDQTGWQPQAVLIPHNKETTQRDEFGNSVTVSGDTVVVGAWLEDSQSTGVNGPANNNLSGNSGAAYVYVRQGTNWSQQAYLKAINPSEFAEFGYSVALDGDLLIVGAWQDSFGSAGVNSDPFVLGPDMAGAAYVFQRTGTNWVQTAYLKASDTQNDAIFGISVGLSSGMAVVSALQAGPNQIGQAYVFDGLLPEIDVQQPPGYSLTSGTRRDLASIDGSLPTATFTIHNRGEDVLKDLVISKSGPDSALFTVTTTINSATEIAPGGSATITVQFAPDDAAPKFATLTIANNDVDENPFIIPLRGLTLSYDQDTDGDGLNDAAEFQLAGIGFDWETSQPKAANALVSNLGNAGFLQTLNIGSPIISRDPQTGTVTLTIGLQQATRLSNFVPLPLTAPQTAVNPAGELEVRFVPNDDAAFFRLESR